MTMTIRLTRTIGFEDTNTIGYYDDLVAKMLACGHPEKMGYLEYRCLHCGQGKHLVSMSCKSALCLSAWRRPGR